MIRIVSGNLLDAKEDIICHQVNCRGVMGSGVAKAIRDRWPDVYRAYKAHVHIHAPELLGTAFLVPINNHTQAIINLFAQNDYGTHKRQTDYNAFYNCLEDVRDSVSRHCSIAFPYGIGCGLGGGSWDVIYAMICDVLGDRDIVIYKLED